MQAAMLHADMAHIYQFVMLSSAVAVGQRHHCKGLVAGITSVLFNGEFIPHGRTHLHARTKPHRTVCASA